MAEKIIVTITTSNKTILRIRERGFMESIGSYKFVIERLESGAFKVFRNNYFHTEIEAQAAFNKIYNLDLLYQKRIQSITKLRKGFEESIKGTMDYDFYQFLDGLSVTDFIINDNNWCRAICRIEHSTSEHNFLKKYNYPTSVKAYEIEIMGNDYAFWLKYSGDEVCLFNTFPYDERGDDKEQYGLLFENKLNVPYY